MNRSILRLHSNLEELGVRQENRKESEDRAERGEGGAGRGLKPVRESKLGGVGRFESIQSPASCRVMSNSRAASPAILCQG